MFKKKQKAEKPPKPPQDKVAYKFRCYPNSTARAYLESTLSACRELYNAGLEERKKAHAFWVRWHKDNGTPFQWHSYLDQQNQLPEIRESCEEYHQIGTHVLQNICQRVNTTWQRYLDRVEANKHLPEGQKKKVGYPRYKGKKQYDFFTFPDIAGWKFTPGNQRAKGKFAKAWLSLTNNSQIYARIAVKQHQTLEGEVKTVTLKREGPNWYVIFVCDVLKSEPFPKTYHDIGLDVGIKVYAATTVQAPDSMRKDDFIENPRWYRTSEDRLNLLQQERDKHKQGSCRYRATTRLIAKHHQHIANQRKDFQHKESTKLIKNYDLIAFERFNKGNLARRPRPKKDEETGAYLPNGASQKAGLNKSILDAGWGTFIGMSECKAEKAGKRVILVPAQNTTQQCSGCGAISKEYIELGVRVYVCEECGLIIDRDSNSSNTILDRAFEIIQQEDTHLRPERSRVQRKV